MTYLELLDEIERVNNVFEAILKEMIK